MHPAFDNFVSRTTMHQGGPWGQTQTLTRHPACEIATRQPRLSKCRRAVWASMRTVCSRSCSAPEHAQTARPSRISTSCAGPQGSAANTSSRRYHMRYHVGSDILRNLTRCSADAPEDLERMLDIPACDACLSGKTGRFGSEQHVPECTKPGEIICLDLWSTRVGCVYNGEKDHVWLVGRFLWLW